MTQEPIPATPDMTGVAWHFAATPAAGAWRARVEAPAGLCAAWQLAKRNTRRTVYRLEAGHASYYVKHDHPRRLQDRLTCLWRCKAEQESRAGAALASVAVPVVPFVAWGRKGQDSFLVSVELQGAAEFAAAWAACRAEPGPRRRFLAGLTLFLKTLLDANVLHPDLHVGNVLVTGTAPGAGAAESEPGTGAVHFHLVDVYGVRVGRPLNAAQRLLVLGLALALGRELDPAEGTAILAPLGLSPGPADSAPATACWCTLVHGFFQRLQRHWPGRKRRLLSSSSLCERHRTTQGTWQLRRPFALDQARLAVEQHTDNVVAGRNLVKVDVKRRLSRVRLGEATFVVKEFVRVAPGPDCLRPDRAAWLNAYRLELAHVPRAACHGWLRAADGRGFLVLEDMGDTTLLSALQAKPALAATRRLMDAAGLLTAWLHGAGLAPGDLTAANLMLVRQPGFGNMPLAVVDYDRILAYPRDVPFVRRAHNLQQLLELLRALVPADDRLQLLQTYSEQAGLSEAEKAYCVTVALG